MPDTSARGPLAGLRVVELAGMGPGPFACMLLADLGAEVIRVERPGGPAEGRVPPASDPIRRGRFSVVLDLKHPDGVASLLEIVARSAVLIEGNRPGVAERLGVGPADCLARNPQLVYARMTGWGQDGPLAATAGHDLTYLAITGALHAMGREGERPAVPLNVVGDYAGGSLYLLLGILAAVREAEQSGQGQVVDAAIIDGVTSLTTVFHAMLSSDMWRDERGVNVLDSGRPWYDVYETSDGKYMAVGAIEPQFYHLFMTLLELNPNVARQEEPESWPALRDEISARFKSETRDHWSTVFEGTDACVAPVLSLTEAAHHPHMAARSAFVEAGEQLVPAPAPRLSRTPALAPAPPHAVGADTRAVLEQLGVADIDGLLASGAAVQA